MVHPKKELPFISCTSSRRENIESVTEYCDQRVKHNIKEDTGTDGTSDLAFAFSVCEHRNLDCKPGLHTVI